MTRAMLKSALQNGHVKVANYVITHGDRADWLPNAKIQYAVDPGQLDMVTWLLSKDLGKEDEVDVSPAVA